MRLAIVALFASAPAAAAPCSVDLVRAPDEVREVVETWVKAEPQCSTALEVRIVPSDGGLFVIARDDRGRIHDRTVPDAQTAGVLITSWAADDDVYIPHAPGTVAAIETTVAVPPLRWRDRSERRWIRAGSFVGLGTAMFGGGNEYYDDKNATGGRASVGVWTHGAWTFDVTVGFVGNEPGSHGYRRPSDGRLTLFYGDLIPSFGYVLRAGNFSLTPSFGLGARYTTMDYGLIASDQGMYWKRSALWWVGQVGVLAAYDILPRLQVTAGPMLTLFPDPWYTNQNAELVMFGGLGWAM